MCNAYLLQVDIAYSVLSTEQVDLVYSSYTPLQEVLIYNISLLQRAIVYSVLPNYR